MGFIGVVGRFPPPPPPPRVCSFFFRWFRVLTALTLQRGVVFPAGPFGGRDPTRRPAAQAAGGPLRGGAAGGRRLGAHAEGLGRGSAAGPRRRASRVGREAASGGAKGIRWVGVLAFFFLGV